MVIRAGWARGVRRGWAGVGGRVPALRPLGSPRIVRAALVPVSALISRIALISTRPLLIPMSSLLRLGRPLPLDFFHRAVEPAQLLAQRVEFPLVGGFLPFSFLQQFEDLVELVDGFAERGDDGHDVINGLMNRGGLGGLEGARWRSRTFFTMPGRLWPDRFAGRFGWLIGHFHVRRCGEKFFVFRRGGVICFGGRRVCWNLRHIIPKRLLRSFVVGVGGSLFGGPDGLGGCAGGLRWRGSAMAPASTASAARTAAGLGGRAWGRR